MSKRTKALGIMSIVGVLALGGSGGYVLIAKPFQKDRPDLIPATVKKGVLELTVVERGALESANNHDIYCRVKARSTTAQTSTTMKWVVDEGTVVLANRPTSEATAIISWDEKTASWLERRANPNGVTRVVEVHDPKAKQVRYADLLVELDDSGLIEQLKDQKIVVDTAESAYIQAKQDYTIQEEKYKTDKKTAETNLALARIDLNKYMNGDYPQNLKDVQGRIKIAESDLEQQRDRTAWADRMLKKGYYTVSQADSEHSNLQSKELALEKVKEEYRVLDDPVYGLKKRTITADENNVDVAISNLNQVEKQWVATEAKYRTDRDTKRSIYDQGVSKYKDITEEIKKCRLYAPIDGLVVYYVPENSRFGVGRQAIIQQGEAVAENQKLMQIPDLKHMLANVKVHEAIVGRVHKGQPAVVKVESMGNKPLEAHVESVATAPSTQDFWASDVKVYATKVAIDHEVEGLKPGMTAGVKITIADALKDVLTIPVQAIVGSAEMGDKRECFVLTPNGREPYETREIVVGMNNDTEAEVISGLKEGEQVVINPKVIVGDKVKTRQPGELSNTREDASKGGEGKGARKGGRRGDAAGPGGASKRGADTRGPGAGGAAGQESAGMGGAQPSPEQVKQMRDALIARMRPLSPEQRKAELNKMPEMYRDRAKETVKGAGLEVKED